jgi:hypothetical protein
MSLISAGSISLDSTFNTTYFQRFSQENQQLVENIHTTVYKDRIRTIQKPKDQDSERYNIIYISRADSVTVADTE